MIYNKIAVTSEIVEITGGDPVGIMYGLLEIKNQLKIEKRTIESKEELFHWSILEDQVKAELEWLKSLNN
ncbi:MAG: hypothetical protein Q7U86_06290 [Draconibacterium sp.]|nr:hypothetical protein [Draconibacterium sp.]